MSVYKQIDKNFFKKWTEEMAYVLGFFAADGNMSQNRRGGCYISFYSSDKKLLFAVQKSMKSKHKLSKRKFENVYRFQVGSIELFNDLLALGFVPNKIKRMRLPHIPNYLIKDFIRGYFDGDGNVWSGFINKKRVKPTKVLQVALTSGSKKFLIDLKNTLFKQGIKGGSIFDVKNKNCSRLLFSTIDSLKLHKIMYNTKSKLYLNRKKLVFDKYVKNAAVVQFG